MKQVTILGPCFNEEDNINLFLDRAIAATATIPDIEFRFLIIDNCSTDNTVALVKQRCAVDPRIMLIVNNRNFGHIRSPYHGLLEAPGDAVICLATDLQDPPELIAELVDGWQKGFKAVMLVKPRAESNSLMEPFRKAYYRFLNKISDAPLINDATGAGLYDRAMLDELRKIRDPYPYFRGLVGELGFPVKKIVFEQPGRHAGITKNNWYTLYDIAMLGIVKHSRVPLRIMVFGGFFVAIVSFLIALGYMLYKLLFWSSFSVGVAPLIIGLFVFGGLQLMMVGLLGEYVATILMHVRGMPLVTERERINFPGQKKTEGEQS
ncbi:dolichol-phosphate mannosyltransferase [Andreprevotia lacus DSM 23236]|jgi:glycosyltransferase involved in cell wall biosynthesis|uniref:Dolichol-phosphate mannosyltransferase n=1 Tax=Andreprevotia lacus DSM 23236 TaxID=1121001 RepID=A0A1W1Y0T9_9NEIS|nr:glycosyltransferase family 2 protein [Andreprevotia lacus]SMC29809.1 dolichol-phosphate mannosyltransferase [Andreprevotia lacus DSM 23236]